LQSTELLRSAAQDAIHHQPVPACRMPDKGYGERFLVNSLPAKHNVLNDCA
jgi:hypothetical protein